ncbi:hypothetical protein COLO4_35658 [Corchorus olitorius]|uniref:Uncharacterized protein n=1 Tax=Corchorus olitorius TaxID=93759 RepID=A0A1R3GEA4_9ROSI|nr:hypothetical protein COLO4_35658 [Corchorus olitorius]
METYLEGVEEKDPKTEPVFDREVGSCKYSTELEEMRKKAEARCVELELEVQRRKSEYAELESKCRTLEAAKLALENEIRVLKSQTQNNPFSDLISHSANVNAVDNGGRGVAEGVVNSPVEDDEEDKVFQLMAEIETLKAEKSKAETEAEEWKKKFKELESLMLQLQKGTGNVQSAGTPLSETPYKHSTSGEGDYIRVQNNQRVRRHLAFQEKRCLIKQMAPSTPNCAKPASVSIIDIPDSDDEFDLAPSMVKQESGKGNISTNYESEGTACNENETRTIGDQNPEEKVGGYADSVRKIRRASNMVTSDTESDDDNVPKEDEPQMDKQNPEEKVGGYADSVRKRRRASNMVTSDTESDDDNVPISKLRRMHYEQVVPNQSKSCTVGATSPGIDDVRIAVTPPKRRLVSLRQSEGRTRVKNCLSKKTSDDEFCKSIPTTEDVDDDDSEEVGSDTEGDSLDGFIVDDSDVADGENGCSESKGDSDCMNDHSGSEDVSSRSSAYSCSESSDDEVNLGMILSKLKRNKDQKSDWKFEGELLAAFGKDPELCMRAVCALYRKQTSDEKVSKSTFIHNQRGFSKPDAPRGCSLGEFLTDGDPQGDVKKSVKELQEYNPKGVELCRHLATRYSKQLFTIYHNKEDPYFQSSKTALQQTNSKISQLESQ